MNYRDAAEYLENWHATPQGVFVLRREQKLLRRLASSWPHRDSRLLLAGCACLLIPLLYYVYEAIFFMGAGAIVNVPANALQAAVGAALGLTVGKLVEKALHNRSQT